MDDLVDQAIALLRRRRPIEFKGLKTSLLRERLREAFEAYSAASPAEILDQLVNDDARCGELLEALLVPVSEFYRDPLVFELILSTLIPKLMWCLRGTKRRQLRIWSAGCGTGEEAYTLAMVLKDAVAASEPTWGGVIIATDLSRQSLAHATEARYAIDRLKQVRLGVFDRYFAPCSAGVEVVAAVRELVSFSNHDLRSDRLAAPAEAVFGSFDLICCRNVLIYYRPAEQQRILMRLHGALAPGGILILGPAETPANELLDRLEVVDGPCSIYRRRASPRLASRAGS